MLGGGPAGRALAGECAALGLSTALVDPAPDRPWRATYGAWADELPAGLPDRVVGARAAARAFGTGPHLLRRTYAVLDTAELRHHLDDRLDGVRVIAGRARDLHAGPGVTVTRLADGVVTADAVVDATGGALRRSGPARAATPARARAAAPLTSTAPRVVTPPLTSDAPLPAGAWSTSAAQLASAARLTSSTPLTSAARRVISAARRVTATRAGPAAEQTAYGVVVPADAAAALVAPGEALFMDWRPDHGHDGPPTFLYAVPYGDGTILLEETSLAARPGLAASELRARLHARLRRHGIHPGDAPVERVRFRVDAPRATGHPVAFGAATPLVHPASGFSVATALALAPHVAAALRDGLDAGGSRAPGRTGTDPAGDGRHATGDEDGLPRAGETGGGARPGAPGPDRTDACDRAAAAARAVLWPPAAVAVHALRRHGLRTVLDLPPDLVPAFFEAFFRLPEHRMTAFLSGRDDVAGTLAAMTGLFSHADPAVRARLLRSVLWPGAATRRGELRGAGAAPHGYR